jgi:CDP-glucose 4,6-dehydratase
VTGELFGDVYQGRRVMVTGHTGFLGGWAVRWLDALGAEVTGYSRRQRHSDVPLPAGLREFQGDIADAGGVAAAMAAFQPEIILHLAGSTTVTAGFRAPAAAFASNVAGTAAVLDGATRQPSVQCAVMAGTPAVTTLGDDMQLVPYAASKLAAEACMAAYAHPRTQQAAGRADPLRVGLARPGVMIGGDWGEGRLLADVVRAVRDGQPVTLGAASAVRPWQHVLDGVSGALALAARQWAGPTPRRRYDFGCGTLDGGPLGGGPREGYSVRDVVSGFLSAYGVAGWPVNVTGEGAGDRLELGYAAAQADLGWCPVWEMQAALTASARWYHAALRAPAAVAATMDDVIAAYSAGARHAWAAAYPAAATT